MGVRRIRRMQRQFDMALSRRVNGSRKEKERMRRDARMATIIKGATFPYIPAVMTWLSEKLDKPASRIVADDVKQVVK